MTGRQDALFDYDAELRRYHQHLRAAAGVRPADRVLDIGCGTGQARLHRRERHLRARARLLRTRRRECSPRISLQMTKDLLAPLDAARTGDALGQLRAALTTHQGSGGVFFDSHAWLITPRP
jgi:SAM-dependent methyltransferase